MVGIPLGWQTEFILLPAEVIIKQVWFIFHTLHCFRRKVGKKKKKRESWETFQRGDWWELCEDFGDRSGRKIKIFSPPQAVWTWDLWFLWWTQNGWKAASCLFIIIFCERTSVCPDPGSSCSSLGFFFWLWFSSLSSWVSKTCGQNADVNSALKAFSAS